MMKINSKLRGFASPIPCSVMAVVLMSVCSSVTLAQDGHSHMSTSQQQPAAVDDQANTLLKIVRNATERFKDVHVAEAEGYAPVFGCVTGDASGAMGIHYLNGAILNSGELDPTRPQIVIYEPLPGGGLQLIGADFLVFADTWNNSHAGPPQLMGQLFHLFDAPNRFGLRPFYTLHVWAWKDNANGAFVNWHPNVSCQSFTGQ
jgi:hypothetical protein